MNTKQLINKSLGIIGEQGMSGIKLFGESTPLAFAEASRLTLPDAKRTLTELKRQSLADIQTLDQQHHIQLTPKGIHRLQESRISSLSIDDSSPWDQRWRMVMFDVPIRYNRRRTQLTTQLKRMNFVMLRDSTWVYPYPCFSQLDELVKHCGLQQFVTYAEISRIDTASSARLLRHFPDL